MGSSLPFWGKYESISNTSSSFSPTKSNKHEGVKEGFTAVRQAFFLAFVVNAAISDTLYLAPQLYNT